MQYKLSAKLIQEFCGTSRKNISQMDNQLVETVALLFGRRNEQPKEITINKIVFPDQIGNPTTVLTEGIKRFFFLQFCYNFACIM